MAHDHDHDHGEGSELSTRLTFLLLVIIAIQSVLVLVNVFLPVTELPVSADAAQVSLGANIWFWLRVGVGLLFPLALAFMAWQSSVVRAMMSATGCCTSPWARCWPARCWRARCCSAQPDHCIRGEAWRVR